MNNRIFPLIVICLFSMTLCPDLLAQNPKVLLHDRASWLPYQELCWVTQLNDGRLARIDLAKEGAESVGILKVSADNGVTWRSQATLRPLPGTGVGGGNLIQTKAGTLIATYAEAAAKYSWDSEKHLPKPDMSLPAYVCRSTDGGKTWTDYLKITDGWCGALIDMKQLKAGRIVATVMDMLYKFGRHYSYTIFSDDDGRTWKFSNLLDLGGQGDHSGAIEPTFEELSDGRLLMLIRTNYDQFWTAYSADKGQSWREIRPSGIEASSAPGYLLKLKSGRMLLIRSLLKGEKDEEVKRNALNLNTAEVQASWYRNEVVVAFSADDGNSWSEPVVLVKSKEDGWPGQISYPYAFERKPGEICVGFRFSGPGPICLKFNESDFLKKRE